MSSVRLIGCDMDGTLLNDRKEISLFCMDAVKSAIRAGYHFVPVTGRPIGRVPDELKQTEGLRYCVVSNGAAIYDLLDERYISQTLICREGIESILKLSEENDVATAAILNGYLCTTHENKRRVIEKYNNPYFSRNYLLNNEVAFDILTEIRENEYRVEKFNMDFFDAETMERCVSLIRQIPYVEISCVGETYLEITARGCNKGVGLRKLTDHLGLRDHETFVIGDSNNDIPMFTPGRVRVAMENAEDEIKRRADFTVPDNNHDGVGVAIRRLLELRDEQRTS